MSSLKNLSIREARDSDSQGLIDLIGTIFSEYDCVLDLDDLDKELLAIRTAVTKKNGDFYVAEERGRIVGCVGYILKGAECNFVELKRLYVALEFRRQGLATKLYDLIIDASMRANARAIDCWSDTRFKEAHAFYLKKGFTKLPETRRLYDPSNTTEFHFIKEL